jgi:hypothetical protein
MDSIEDLVIVLGRVLCCRYPFIIICSRKKKEGSKIFLKLTLSSILLKAGEQKGLKAYAGFGMSYKAVTIILCSK